MWVHVFQSSHAYEGYVPFFLAFYLKICVKSLQGELWGWTCFFIGVAAVAFGSSYYHLKPNDARLVWDRLPVSAVLNTEVVLETTNCIDVFIL